MDEPIPEHGSVLRELASGVDALYLSGHGYLPRALLARLGAALGLRWSEVAGLRVGRLDLNAGRWLPAAAAVGCAGAGFHDLRRLNAATLVVEGIDVNTAQTRLGHSNPRVTLSIYAWAPASIDRDAADVIGERFFGERGDGDPGRHERD